ncbi:hypothetical protein DL768_010409 [Monosporascus sp. mg162]|nr:hypothetical protein DL768_010409 [Monosporascus sp. mg162]
MADQYLRLSLLLAVPFFLSFTAGQDASACKPIPGDASWPSDSDWSSLNDTPYNNYNATACQTLQDVWNSPETFEFLPAEMINPTPQNQSCDPYTPKERPCTLGNYPVYSINVTGAGDVAAGIRFAQENNIRLTIKNTGHDYIGKSVGAGSLSLWTYNLQTLEVIDNYRGPLNNTNSTYNGPAVKLGPGVIGGNAYTALAARGYRIVGGSCPSVGLAGGYTPGGGHSLLNSKYGMAADNVLEWEVVTAGGEHLIATPAQNRDLYWALSGGGAGTFAVVLSMTTKIFRDGPVAGGTLSFTDTDTDVDTFWEATGAWFKHMPKLVEGGNTYSLVLSNHLFSVVGMTLPDQDETAVESTLAPFLTELESLGVNYTMTTSVDDTFVQHFDATFGPLPYGGYPPNTLFASRIIPRSVVLDPEANRQVVQVYRNALAGDYFTVGCHTFTVQHAGHHDNAVLPAWRDAAALCNYVGNWDWTVPRSVMDGRKQELADTWMPAIEAATPGAGAYLNEVDSMYKGDWIQELYGMNYPRLLEIKNKYDPNHTFYARTAVGSEFWAQDGAGRLCRL